MSPYANQISAPPAREWFIQVDGQAYGPFTDVALWSFICEGRVTDSSLVSQSSKGQYRPVSADPGLMNWIAQAPKPTQPTITEPKALRPANAQPEIIQRQPVIASQSAPLTVFIIMAEIRSGKGMDFLRMLQGLGQVERIGDSLWLLKAGATVDDIRNILSQPLTLDDRLFIMDCFANRPVWFNIGSDMDRRIQDMWEIES